MNGSGGSLIELLNPQALPMALLLIGAVFLMVRLIDRLVERASAKLVSRRLVIRQSATIINFVLYCLAGVGAFGMVFNLSSEALLAVSGTVAVTLGFAFKDVAASFLAGLSILTNKPFQVGDRISFGGFYGEVKEIGLRTVRLVTLDDNLVTIPSNKFLTDAVASANAGSLDCMVVMKFYISAEADHIQARHLVRDSVLASKYLYLGKPIVMLIDNTLTNRGHLVVELTAKAYVFDTRYEKQFASDVTDRALRSFKERGITLPGTNLEASLQSKGIR